MKKRKKVVKSKLSFATEDDDNEDNEKDEDGEGMDTFFLYTNFMETDDDIV